MLVVSYLSQQFLPRLAAAIQDIRADHVHASSWDEVEDFIQRRPVSVLVLDPYADRANRTDDIVRLLQRFPSTPIIVYTEFAPPALRMLTLLAQYGLQETLLFQIDDDCPRLSRLLRRLSILPLVLRLLHELRSERRQLAQPLAEAIDDLFQRPYAYTSGRDLVQASQTPLTSLYRTLMEAGFAPPKQLFIAARVLHAAVYVRYPGSTVQQVAEKIGYQHPRVLTQHTLAVFDLRPSALRNISDDEVLPHLLYWTKLKKSIQDTIPITDSSTQGPLEEHRPEVPLPSDNTTDHPFVAAPDIDSAVIWGTLLGYGQYLESCGRWKFAVYVYCTIVDTLSPADGCSDPVAVAAVFLRLGFVLRFLGIFDTSYAAYQHARRLAEQENIIPFALRSCIGIANTLMRRGNLRDAEILLDEVVADASTSGIVSLESKALHSRAAVRFLRERYADAMTDFFKAYKLTDHRSERELIFGDIAACAGEAGYWALADHAHRVLLRIGRLPITQSASLGGLLESAVYFGDSAEFERLQERIKAHAKTYSMPADHILHIALYTAYGTERFDTRDAAITAYQTVIEQARSIGSHQIAFKAEKRLTALMTGVVTPVNPPIHEPPDSLRDLVNTIAEWSILASHTS